MGASKKHKHKLKIKQIKKNPLHYQNVIAFHHTMKFDWVAFGTDRFLTFSPSRTIWCAEIHFYNAVIAIEYVLLRILAKKNISINQWSNGGSSFTSMSQVWIELLFSSSTEHKLNLQMIIKCNKYRYHISFIRFHWPNNNTIK